jgi:tetratricopeptide (TPR) repeat protein
LRRPALFLAALVLLSTCGCAKRVAAPPPTPVNARPAEPATIPPAEPVVSPPPEPAVAPPPTPVVAPADRAFASGAAAMAEGNYERALEMFTAAWKESPGHAGVARDFSDALSGLKKSGDEAFRQGRLEEAGRRWSAAIRYLSNLAEKGKPLPFTKAELQAGIDKASDALMEKGLVEYRKGNIEAAIVIWKSILAYDPSHAEAARSVRTAATQLENLKKINPPK